MREDLLKAGAFSWFELMTDNVDAAKEFYTRLFGWELEKQSMEQGGDYWVVKMNGEGIGGMMQKPPEAAQSPNYWATYVTVESVETTVATAKAVGGTVLVPPTDIPNVGRFCVIMDPQGAVISAIRYLEQ
jgi:hypothetical protein